MGVIYALKELDLAMSEQRDIKISSLKKQQQKKKILEAVLCVLIFTSLLLIVYNLLVSSMPLFFLHLGFLWLVGWFWFSVSIS